MVTRSTDRKSIKILTKPERVVNGVPYVYNMVYPELLTNDDETSGVIPAENSQDDDQEPQLPTNRTTPYDKAQDDDGGRQSPVLHGGPVDSDDSDYSVEL